MNSEILVKFPEIFLDQKNRFNTNMRTDRTQWFYIFTVFYNLKQHRRGWFAFFMYTPAAAPPLRRQAIKKNILHAQRAHFFNTHCFVPSKPHFLKMPQMLAVPEKAASQ